MEKLITQRALSDLLGRSIKSLERDRQRGTFPLPYIRLGRKIMFRRSDVERFLDLSAASPRRSTQDHDEDGAGAESLGR